jgi:Peptidase family M41
MQVTNMARQMVINYGFSDIGPWSLLDPSAQGQDVIMRMMARNSVSESLQRKIDTAVKKIASEAYEVALNHIKWAPCLGPTPYNDLSTLLSGLFLGAGCLNLCAFVVLGPTLLVVLILRVNLFRAPFTRCPDSPCKFI